MLSSSLLLLLLLLLFLLLSISEPFGNCRGQRPYSYAVAAIDGPMFSAGDKTPYYIKRPTSLLLFNALLTVISEDVRNGQENVPTVPARAVCVVSPAWAL